MRLALAAMTVAIAGAAPASADEIAPTAVSHGDYGEVAESLTGVPGDPEQGAIVMTSRGLGNCIACHQVTDLEEFPFHGEVGPSLDGAASRWTEEDLRGIVVNAKMVFPGTIMPAFYKSTGFNRPGDGYTGRAAESEELPPILTAQQVEDVVAYLMTLQNG